jgi:tetratricopeptide (TPR) repeat protein
MARRHTRNAAATAQARRSNDISNAFVQSVGEALDFIWNPTHLGERSPLAAPYFLGDRLGQQVDAVTPIARGQTLAAMLSESVNGLEPALRQVLTLYYLDAAIRGKRNRGDAVALKLNYARATVMRNRREGVEAVAKLLGEAVIPPLRGDWPGMRSVVGRKLMVNTLMAALAEQQTVVLTGPSGIGKTSVGYVLAETWGRKRALWYTLRPGLNDRMLSFVLTLGYFLRGLGAGRTWAQLVADGGRLHDDELISGLIRADLASLPRPPLICVDEVDVLRAELQEHSRLRLFIESLRGHVPLLLIGQRSVISALEPNHEHELDGLAAQDYDDLLAREGLFYLSDTDRDHLLRATRGSPTLIRLFALLHQGGETIVSVFGRIGSASTTEAMLNRVWLKLESDERRLLAALAVFQGYAPRDAWVQSEAQAAIDTLIARGLVDDDGQGGIAVAAFARELVARQSTADTRRVAHESAALMREQRGEYSLAVLHYLDCGQFPAAIRLWTQHRHAERAKGYGPAVLSRMRDVPVSLIENDDDRAAFAIAISDLMYAEGDAHAILNTLAEIDWRADHPLTPIAHALKGNAHLLNGDSDAAVASYQSAYSELERPAQSIRANVLRQLGYVHTYVARDLAAARRASWQARFEAEILAGNVEEECGDYAAAKAHFSAALLAAGHITDNARQLHDVYADMGRLLMRAGEYDASLELLERAIAIGKTLRIEQLLALGYNNLAAVNIMKQNYESALAAARTGLEICERLNIKSGYHRAGLATNAGEANYYLGRYTEALRIAQYALDIEEPVFDSYAYAVIGMVRRALGEYELSHAALDRALACAVQQGDRYAEASALREVGLLYRVAERTAEAQAAFERSAAVFDALDNAAERDRVRALMRGSSPGTDRPKAVAS